MEIVDDHVHLFLEFRPSYSLSRVVQFLKGGSSYRMFKLHPELKKRYWGGSLWSSGKFFRSVGNVTADTIQHYIKESQGKPKAESKVCRSRESGQRRLDDFWSPANRACARPEAYPIPLGWGGRAQFDSFFIFLFITSGVQRVTNTPTFRLGMKWTLARFLR